MKFQIVILSAVLLLTSAFSLPVPDEEVSPVKAVPLPEVKSEVVQKPAVEQPVEVAKPESRSAELAADQKPAATEEKKIVIGVPSNAPEAELPASLPEAKKEEEQKEIKTEEKKSEKSVRVEDSAAAQQTLKALPEESKQQPQVEQQVHQQGHAGHIEGKSAEIVAAPVVAEQKKEELSAAEETPIVKSDVAPVAEKKEELPARQERDSEKKAQDVVVEKGVPAEAPAEVVPAVKSLNEEIKPAESNKQEVAAAETVQLKSAEPIEKKAEPESHAAAGDIPQPALEDGKTKTLPEQQQPLAQAQTQAEGKKIEETPVAAETVDAAASPVVDQLKATETAKPIEDPVKPLAEKEQPQQSKSSSEEKSDEKKSKESESKENDSKESEESKESDESKSN